MVLTVPEQLQMEGKFCLLNVPVQKNLNRVWESGEEKMKLICLDSE